MDVSDWVYYFDNQWIIKFRTPQYFRQKKPFRQHRNGFFDENTEGSKIMKTNKSFSIENYLLLSSSFF